MIVLSKLSCDILLIHGRSDWKDDKPLYLNGTESKIVLFGEIHWTISTENASYILSYGLYTCSSGIKKEEEEKNSRYRW